MILQTLERVIYTQTYYMPLSLKVYEHLKNASQRLINSNTTKTP